MDLSEPENQSEDSSSSYVPSESDSNSETVESETAIEETVQHEIIEDEQTLPNRGRKRGRNDENWIKNKRKRHRNEGKEYISSKGRLVPQKTFLNLNCNCKKKCNNLIIENNRKQLHDSFWKLGDFSKQNVFIHSLIQSQNVKQKRPRNGSKEQKSVSHNYFLKMNNISIKVCKKFFLQTLNISDGRLYRILSKKQMCDITDLRGKKTPANKIDDSEIISHIKSFPAFQSHYSRKDNPERKYLHPDLTIHKMYEMYCEQCKREHKTPVKEKFYYNVFSKKFNLHFKPPVKDSCRTCDEMNLKLLAETDNTKKEDLLLQKSLHLAKAKQARDSLKKDQSEASDKKYVATFDLQKALPFPKLSTSIAYYKRNMYIYNFGVHSSGIGYMHMWDETEGGRGSQDIASCLAMHLKNNANSHDHIILYSDSCTGQNRNIKVALTLLKLAQNNNMKVQTIDLKFLLSGHSFLPNDADFGIIEKASKKCSHINSPEDWVDIVKNAKRTKSFKVIEMKRSDFLSTKNLEESITNRKKNVKGDNVSWLKIRWFRFERGSPFVVKYKETLQDYFDFDEISLEKAVGKGRKILNLPEEQEILYSQRRPVTELKKRDMLDLLPYIPPIHHRYFKNLPTETKTRSCNNNSLTVQSESQSDDDELYY